MSRFLVLATAGAGGDLQPLLAVGTGLSARGHDVMFAGDGSVAAELEGSDEECLVLPPEHDLGPVLGGAIRESMSLPDAASQAALIRGRIEAWSSNLAQPVRDLIRDLRPDVLVTSLFGAGVAGIASRELPLPWVVVNSTFYIGPNPPRALAEDFTPRPIPLVQYLGSELDNATLVLHATDRHFDMDFDGLPHNHEYVGPLIWERPSSPPTYLGEEGDPWVLVTVSTQTTEALPVVEAALRALADRPVRVVATLGAGAVAAESLAAPVNARVAPFVPHGPVLEHSLLMVSHAGHGSVMKALLHGVPMVLVPWGADQPGVAARAARLGAAEVVQRERLLEAPDEIAAALDLVLDDPIFGESARRESARLRSEKDPVARACDLIESLLN